VFISVPTSLLASNTVCFYLW